jgi:hydroxyethylthiazole kinase-like uncharacterized protein yjeF
VAAGTNTNTVTDIAAASSRCAVLTVAEMAAADRLTIEGGTPGIRLMEAAGAAVVTEILRRWSKRATLVLCGPGNNGGDGFIVARILSEFGWPVRVALLDMDRAAKGDAALAQQRWRGETVATTVGCLDNVALIVDAMFGAGLDRPLSGIAKELVHAIAARNLDCVAVDMPSGVSGDTGRVLGEASGCAPLCRLTVSFCRPKPGHFLEPARGLCGALVVAPIGIGDDIVARLNPQIVLNDPSLWRDCLHKPGTGDHKYTRGHAVVLGGATMTGAARLSARAARRIGAGLLTIASPPESVAIYADDEPGAIVRAIRTDADFERLVSEPRVSAILVGPGAGLDDATRRRVLLALSSHKPCVLDADALSVFADTPDILLQRLGPHCLLTPHEGEFARLFPDLAEPAALAGGKLARTRTAAHRSGATVLLKGADTVIAQSDGAAVLSPFGPPTLATGGSGDVLAGLAVGLMAQGMPAFWAAAAASWLQGEAARAIGPGLIADDLPAQIAPLLARLGRRPSR